MKQIVFKDEKAPQFKEKPGRFVSNRMLIFSILYWGTNSMRAGCWLNHSGEPDTKLPISGIWTSQESRVNNSENNGLSKT
ncbi:MAG: hypothetical protein MI749_11120 [Desulfovibrionales bacterium]|nr:hypothetical protein [Desulfovibrionales bacterium]